MSDRSRSAAAAALVALVAFLPFLRGTLSGASLYFRDLSLHFFPLRRFALEGLRQGELRLWNPYVHEGVPLSLPALGYPFDLLGLLSPSEAFLSLLLALHVPLGALFFFRLARGLGLGLEAACGGALVYALGGFYLSTVNLYVYLQAAAWAPLLVLALVRLLAGGERSALAGAALAVAVALSTTGVEIVAQAIVAGVLLGLCARGPLRAAGRLAAALGLGAALAAPVLVLVAGQLEGSARGHGFTPDVVLAHSVHPFALVQIVVGGLFGNPANLANEWWGQNFFPRGFPYVLSLYLGASALALAVAGAADRRAPAPRLLALLALGLVVALGRWGGLTPFVEAAPWLRLFRFPVKAFFTVHLALALLAGLGLQALANGRRRLTLALAAGSLGTLLLATPLLPHAFPGPLGSFAAAFLPPGFAPDARAALLAGVLRDAATGGAVALAVALVALLASRGQLSGSRPAWLVVTLVAADLLRTGAGLNPMVSSAFYAPSAELGERLPGLREGRVYTCPLETSPAFHAGRIARTRDHELWSFGVLAETLSPSFNVPRGVPTALSPDLTGLVPTERVLGEEQGACTSLSPLLPRLREAAVTTVLSLDPLEHAELAPLFVLATARSEPVAVHAYALQHPLARTELAGPGRIREVRFGANHVQLVAESDEPATLVVRDAWAPGWRARVDGEPRPLRPLGRHRSVALPAGRSLVDLEYRHPGLAAAVALGLLAALALGVTCLRRPRHALLAALLAIPAAGTARAAPQSSGPPQPPVNQRLADIPFAAFRPDGVPPTRLLRRSVDLLQMLWTGQGTFSADPSGPRDQDPSVALHALPWAAPEYARVTDHRFGDRAEEGTLSLHLWSGERWCTPALELPAESRLRLEALAVGRSDSARLRVSWHPERGAGWESIEKAGRPASPTLETLDLPLPRGRGSLCLQAEAGAVSVGEPRILSPEPEGSDRRPRWIVITVCDALRGDILGHARADRIAPALVALSRRGLIYDQAVSPGAHTQAALLPLLTGRYLARVDPARARRFNAIGTPLNFLYSRGNIAVSHLAQAVGYHTVFLGNNSFLTGAPAFARFSNRPKPDTGTLDTIAALPATLRRYADERVLLVYYLSTPHNYSATPRRLHERFGCASLTGMAAERCAYDARVAHADEAIEALQQGLAYNGLDGLTLQVLTADHGEVFGDGRKLETELYAKWYSLDEGHGGATHWNEIHVPLLVTGPGLEPARWSGRVSTLDVVPTLAKILGSRTPHRLDGRVLPLLGGPRTAPDSITSQGFCSDSVLEGSQQFVLWGAECARRRPLGGGLPLTHRAELWRNGSLQATDASDPDRLRPWIRQHLEWLSARLPDDAWIIDGSRLGAASVHVLATRGEITDWGPSSGPAYLGAVAMTLGSDGRRLRIDFRGDQPGLVYVSTWPKDAPVRFELDESDGPTPVTFVGALQLPLALVGRVVDPLDRPELWRATAQPAAQPALGPHLRVWRQPYRADAQPSGARGVAELDRVLREWGYIR